MESIKKIVSFMFKYRRAFGSILGGVLIIAGYPEAGEIVSTMGE